MLTTFGKALYKMLIDKDMRPKDLAQKMGYSKPYISTTCHDNGLRVPKRFIDDLEKTGVFSYCELKELRSLENNELH